MKVSLENSCFICWMKIEVSSFICVLVLQKILAMKMTKLWVSSTEYTWWNPSSHCDSQFKIHKNWKPYERVWIQMISTQYCSAHETKPCVVYKGVGFNIARNILKSNQTIQIHHVFTYTVKLPFEVGSCLKKILYLYMT